MDYTEYNNANIKIALKNWCNTVFKREFSKVLAQSATRMCENIHKAFNPLKSGNEQFPVYTGNLHDSIGIAVIVDGSLKMFMPPTVAVKPQRLEKKGKKTIWGRVELNNLSMHTYGKYNKGFWVIMYSAVPYSEKIELYGSESPYGSRGKGYFDFLEEEMIAEVYAAIEALTPL